MGIPLRQQHKQKPQAWGPFSAVQSALFHNAERIGIDPAKIALAMPMWNPGDQFDYANRYEFSANGATFQNGSTYIDSAQSLSLSDTTLHDRISSSFLLLTSVRIDAETTGFHRIFSKDKTSEGDYRDLELYMEDSTQVKGNLNFKTGDDALFIEENVSSFEIGKDLSIAAVQDYSASRQYLYPDGDRVGALTSVNVLSSYANNYWIGNWSNTGTRALEGAIHYLLVLKGAYEETAEAIVQKVHDNPYALWQPVPQKTIFPPIGDTIFPINRIFNGPFNGPFAGAL